MLIFFSLSAIGMLINLWYTPNNVQSAYFRIDGTELPYSLTTLIDVDTLRVKQGDTFSSYMYDKGGAFKQHLGFFSAALQRYEDAEVITKNDYDILQTSDYIAYQLGFKGRIKDVVNVMQNAPIDMDDSDDILKSIILCASFDDRIFVETSSGYYMLTLGMGQSFDYSIFISQIAPAPVAHMTIGGRYMFSDIRDKSFNAITVNNELDGNREDIQSKLSQLLFGDRQDFVQELIDVNGATLMIYGYGDKTLKIGRDGLIDYTQTIDKRLLSSRDSDFYSNLSSAYGVIKKLEITETPVYLRSATPITYNGTSGYDFKFYYVINGYPVDNVQHTAGIDIRMAGGELISYTRDIKRPKSMALITSGKSLNEIVSAALSDGILPNDSDIQSIRALYTQDVLTLIPTYQITTTAESYYFDAHTGTLLFKGGE